MRHLHNMSMLAAALALAGGRMTAHVHDPSQTVTNNEPEETPDVKANLTALTSRQVRRQLERKERKRRKLK